MERRQALRRAIPDILAGAIFVAFGLAFALTSTTYEIGSPLDMGPGFFPLVLGAILVLFGVFVIASGFTPAESEVAVEIGTVPWRATVLITAAFVIFGLTVRGLGVVPALFITTLLSALSSASVRPLTALVIAAGLTVLSVVIFIILLQLRLPLFGPWLRF